MDSLVVFLWLCPSRHASVLVFSVCPLSGDEALLPRHLAVFSLQSCTICGLAFISQGLLLGSLLSSERISPLSCCGCLSLLLGLPIPLLLFLDLLLAEQVGLLLLLHGSLLLLASFLGLLLLSTARGESSISLFLALDLPVDLVFKLKLDPVRKLDIQERSLVYV